VGVLDHWHPVAIARELGKQPLAVRLAGHDLALYRTQDGRVAALDDTCAHRGMRLSAGHVEGTRLVCPYHAWAFDPEGQGRSPATPDRKGLCTTAYAAIERDGAVWVKAAGVPARFPETGIGNYAAIGLVRRRAAAPLELVLDNFCEVEHTPGTHALLGYDAARLPEVTTRVEVTPDTVRVINEGPQKRIPRVFEVLLGVRTHDRFVDDWVTRFSPVHAVYDHWWADPKTGARRDAMFRTTVYFVPIDAQTTDLYVFAAAAGNRIENPLSRALFRPLALKLVEREIDLDCAMLAKLRDHRTSLEGRKLGRFDKALAENRKRLASLYYGEGLAA
jgi:vanillate O-demethylase monooxygenase subunit